MVVKVYLVDYTSPFSLINTRFFYSIWSSLVCHCRGLFKKSGGNLLAELTFGVWLDVNTPAINRLPFPWLRINCRWEWCSIFSYQITIILLESCAFVYYPLATWRFSSRTRWRQQSRVSHMPSSWWKREPCLIHTGQAILILFYIRCVYCRFSCIRRRCFPKAPVWFAEPAATPDMPFTVLTFYTL